jgi:hypothetical protein
LPDVYFLALAVIFSDLAVGHRTGFPDQGADAIFAEYNCTTQLTAVACGGTFTSSQ